MRFSNFQRCVVVNPAKDVPGPVEANYPNLPHNAPLVVPARWPDTPRPESASSIETKLQMRTRAIASAARTAAPITTHDFIRVGGISRDGSLRKSAPAMGASATETVGRPPEAE